MSEREKLKKLAERCKAAVELNRKNKWDGDSEYSGAITANPSTILALLSELEQAERERDVTRAATEKAMAAWEPLIRKYSIGKVGENVFVSAAEWADASEAALRTLRQASAKSGIYIASKTHHAEKWKALRAQGVPIISTWIDEAGIGETKSFPDLWRRCISEASSAELLIVYAEEGEQLKGALIEVGAALAGGVPVVMVGEIEPMKTAVNHSLVSKAESLEIALAAALAAEGGK